ncbi:MAG: ferredoxin [Opitutaceae bacterium]|nr:ferredoxin [Opitutaceae bacterium]
MANKDDKWENNVPGKFYVDQQCIDCDLCRETAPGFFTRHDDGGHSYVFKQPTTQEEIDQCMEALEGCPVEAIGADGGDSGSSAGAHPQASVTPQATGEHRS